MSESESLNLTSKQGNEKNELARNLLYFHKQKKSYLLDSKRNKYININIKMNKYTNTTSKQKKK